MHKISLKVNKDDLLYNKMMANAKSLSQKFCIGYFSNILTIPIHSPHSLKNDPIPPPAPLLGLPLVLVFATAWMNHENLTLPTP